MASDDSPSHPYNHGDVVRVSNQDYAKRKTVLIRLSASDDVVVSMDPRRGGGHVFFKEDYHYNPKTESFEVRSPVVLSSYSEKTAGIVDILVRETNTIADGKIDFPGLLFDRRFL